MCCALATYKQKSSANSTTWNITVTNYQCLPKQIVKGMMQPQALSATSQIQYSCNSGSYSVNQTSCTSNQNCSSSSCCAFDFGQVGAKTPVQLNTSYCQPRSLALDSQITLMFVNNTSPIYTPPITLLMACIPDSNYNNDYSQGNYSYNSNNSSSGDQDKAYDDYVKQKYEGMFSAGFQGDCSSISLMDFVKKSFANVIYFSLVVSTTIIGTINII
ncbi:UNKNOWN [Stylonychia lemnae]|uniref:Transmembrane protein n=1 Tax=Stylonychia lemnae TaxID=5949 RepID=A0A078AFX4_STYLE|nr:UNKNOWN [Stylonychia lemnae]|eukprot:CDW80746.1 UNKNOWN [Stylonychia lemnae]